MGARALLLAVGWQLSILSLVTDRCDGLFWCKNIVSGRDEMRAWK